MSFNHVISRQSVVVSTKGLLASDLEDEIILLDTNSGCYFGLNAVASSIWKLIENPKTVKDIQDSLISKYDVDSKQCEQHLLLLLQELQGEGLIEVKDAAVV